ncbi:MAG: hypothetical protein KAS19_00700 [Anaerolineales bacterium]|nr:hypothetical protein [Anaerolineales bacterium]
MAGRLATRCLATPLRFASPPAGIRSAFGYGIQSSPVKPHLALLAGRTAGWTIPSARDERLDERRFAVLREGRKAERGIFESGPRALRASNMWQRCEVAQLEIARR